MDMKKEDWSLDRSTHTPILVYKGEAQIKGEVAGWLKAIVDPTVPGAWSLYEEDTWEPKEKVAANTFLCHDQCSVIEGATAGWALCLIHEHLDKPRHFVYGPNQAEFYTIEQWVHVCAATVGNKGAITIELDALGVAPVTAQDVHDMKDMLLSGQAEEHHWVHFLHRLLPPGPKAQVPKLPIAETAGLPQGEGADWFLVADKKSGVVHYGYSADLGRDFGHDHIKGLQELGESVANLYVVPANGLRQKRVPFKSNVNQNSWAAVIRYLSNMLAGTLMGAALEEMEKGSVLQTLATAFPLSNDTWERLYAVYEQHQKDQRL